MRSPSQDASPYSICCAHNSTDARGREAEGWTPLRETSYGVIAIAQGCLSPPMFLPGTIAPRLIWSLRTAAGLREVGLFPGLRRGIRGAHHASVHWLYAAPRPCR